MSRTFLPEHTQQALELIKNKYLDKINKFGFYLAGGTALAFTLQYRVSYDLDFFTKESFNQELLLNSFKDINPTNIEISEGTLKFVANLTNFSFFEYPYPLVDNLELNQGIYMASVRDIALMKVTAIAGRAVKKDFYDLYYASHELGGMDIVLKYLSEKYKEANLQHYIKSLLYFDEAEGSVEPDFIKEVVSWDDLKRYFKTQVESFIKN